MFFHLKKNRNASMTLCLLAGLFFMAVVDGPQKIIIDTDMGFDVDDVGAVCLGNALMAANKTGA